MLSDLRESGALEQDADIVCFIYRDDYYNPDTEQKNVAELIVAKHRNGPVGTVNLFFQKDTTHFFDLTPEHLPRWPTSKDDSRGLHRQSSFFEDS